MKKGEEGFMGHLVEDFLLVTLIPWVLKKVHARKQCTSFDYGLRFLPGGSYLTLNNFAGWTPQTFTSSRKKRAEIIQQDVTTYLDEDEKAVCVYVILLFLGVIVLNK